MLDPRLREFCYTQRQLDVFEAVFERGTHRRAAKRLGCHRTNVDATIRRIKQQAAEKGYSPSHDMTRIVPDGFAVKGVSTLYNAEGEVSAQWVKSSADADARRAVFVEMVEGLSEEIPSYKAGALDIAALSEDIIPWFQIGDAHLGMVSYMMETGQNFDLDVAVREIRQAFRMLLEKSPAAKRCVINDLGDFTHYENFTAETERGKHRLDADTRFPKMIRVYTRLWRELIELALEKYETVDVIINQGNHSRTNDIWASEYSILFAELIEARYGETGRVNVLNNDSVFLGYLMGETFVMTHHSDKCSGEKLVDVMFRDFFEAVKQARHLYIDTGHIHHKNVKKERGVVLVQSWNNLAPNDKHHHDAGYRSKLSMSVAIRSKRYGEIGQHTIPVQMIWDALQGEKTSTPTENRHFSA